MYLQHISDTVPWVIAGGAQGGSGASNNVSSSGNAGAGGCRAFSGTYAGSPDGGNGFGATPGGRGSGGGGVNGRWGGYTNGGGGGAGQLLDGVNGQLSWWQGSSMYPNEGSCATGGGGGGSAGSRNTGGYDGYDGSVTFNWTQTTLYGKQTITCGTANPTYGDADFDLPTAGVTTSTGDPAGVLGYGNASGACSEVDGKLRVLSGGTCSYQVTAAQTDLLDAPDPKTCTVAIARMPTSITVNPPASLAVGASIALPIAPVPALENGEAVAYTASPFQTCIINASSGILTGRASGTCTVTAKRNGTTNLLPSTVSTGSLEVVAPAHTLSGTVSGLSANVYATLSNNDAPQSPTFTNGAFSIPALPGAYHITATAPNHQCTVSGNGQGTATANVSNIQVTCALVRYKLSGTVNGLDGTIILATSSSSANVTSTGASATTFEIANALPHGQAYTLSVQSQPFGQTCTVGTRGTGNNITADVSGAVVTCAYGLFPLTANVIGLHGGGKLVLRNNNGTPITVTGSGTGTDTPSFGNFLHKTPYSVSIQTQPYGQTCTLNSSASGQIWGATSVQVRCTTAPGDFDYTDVGVGTWTVPQGVYKITIEAASGGGGGSRGNSFVSSGGTRGQGALVIVTDLDVRPGEVFTYRIGDGGTNNTNSITYANGIGYSAYGGGSTGVYRQGATPADYPLVIAGGGSGGGVHDQGGLGAPVWGKYTGTPGNCVNRAYNPYGWGTPEGGKGSGGAAGGGGVNGTGTGGGGVAGIDAHGYSTYPDTPLAAPSTTTVTCTADGGAGGTAGPANGIWPVGTSAKGGKGWVKFHAPLTKGTQTLVCGTDSKTWGDADFNVPTASVSETSTGDAGGAISYGTASGACTLADNLLHITSAGTCSYQASAAETDTLGSATASCTVNIAKAPTSIAIANTPTSPLTMGASTVLTVAPTPALALGETMAFSSDNTGICTVASNGTLTAAGPGTCNVTATRSGNTNLLGSTSNPITISVVPPVFTISGTVTGLVGGQIASVSNGTTTQGSNFSFSVTQGNSYTITASAQHHSCTPLTGGPVTADVLGLQLVCQPLKYSISGTVTGIPADTTATVTLGSATQPATNGAFNFGNSVAYNSPYSVAATATGYTCTPATGTVSGDVIGVVVACTVNKYTLSYTLTGLAIDNTVVLNLGGVDKTHTTNGSDSYTNALTHGQPYALVVKTQPVGQTCTVSANGSGSNATVDVTGVVVACVTAQYTISATVSGLPGSTTLVLLNNGGDDLSVSTNGLHGFATKVNHNSPYAVTVQTAPNGYTCTVANGTGTATADVGNITVACTAQPRTVGGTITGLTGNARVQLSNPNAPAQTLGNGPFSFATTYGSAYAITASTPVGHTCSVANGSGTVSADVVNVLVACQGNTYTLIGTAQPAIGGHVSCPAQTVAHGTNTACTATAQAGWRFKAFDAASACTRTSGAAGSTCEIDDVQANRTLTAQFVPYFAGPTVPGAGGTSATATASFTGGGATCRFDTSANTAFVAAPATLPAGQTMPHGMLQFKLIGCDTSPVTMSVTWPTAVQGLSKWGKVTSDAVQNTHFAPTGLQASGNTTSFTVQDGQLGDDDWTVNGEIVDPVGATVPAAAVATNPTPVPTLSQWALVLLSLLAAALGMGMLRCRRQTGF